MNKWGKIELKINKINAKIIIKKIAIKIKKKRKIEKILFKNN